MECESPEDLCDVATEVLCLILFWGERGWMKCCGYEIIFCGLQLKY